MTSQPARPQPLTAEELACVRAVHAAAEAERLAEYEEYGDPRHQTVAAGAHYHRGRLLATIDASGLVSTPPAAQVDRMPTLDEAYRFIRSNPITTLETLVETTGLGTEDRAEVSGGRFRELWKLAGGAVDKKDRAWIEMDLLPAALRLIVDAIKALTPAAQAPEAPAAATLCSDCPPVGYPHDRTRCFPCPRRTAPGDALKAPSPP